MLAAGVKGLLLTGTNLHESEQAQLLAQRYERCWSTAGVHPHDSSQWTQHSAETLHALAKMPQVVAIGECGLDFNRNFSTPEDQESIHRTIGAGRRAKCQCSCIAAMRMSVLSPFWNRGWINCLVLCCTALPDRIRTRWIA